MASIDSVQSATASVIGSLLRATDDNTAVAAALIKKATDADKDLVNTLLPSTGLVGRVNVSA